VTGGVEDVVVVLEMEIDVIVDGGGGTGDTTGVIVV